MSLHISQSYFCVPHIFTLQSWYVANDLPRTWGNHSITHQVHPIALGETKQGMKTWRVGDDTSPAEVALMPSVWVRVSWCESSCSCWIGTIKFTLFPSLLGGPDMSMPVCRYCLCSRDCRCNLTNSGDRMTKVNKDMKSWLNCTYTLSLVFITPSSYWNWSAVHLIFHRRKTQGASSRYLSDNPLSGEGRFVWDGGHMIEESMWSTDIQISLVGVCSEAVSPALKSSVNVSLCHRNMSNLALFLSTHSVMFCTHFFSASLSRIISNSNLLLHNISANYAA